MLLPKRILSGHNLQGLNEQVEPFTTGRCLSSCVYFNRRCLLRMIKIDVPYKDCTSILHGLVLQLNEIRRQRLNVLTYFSQYRLVLAMNTGNVVNVRAENQLILPLGPVACFQPDIIAVGLWAVCADAFTGKQGIPAADRVKAQNRHIAALKLPLPLGFDKLSVPRVFSPVIWETVRSAIIIPRYYCLDGEWSDPPGIPAIPRAPPPIALPK